MMGFGFNAVTGDFSRGAGGFLIENGELGRPVSEVTISRQLRRPVEAHRRRRRRSRSAQLDGVSDLPRRAHDGRRSLMTALRALVALGLVAAPAAARAGMCGTPSFTVTPASYGGPPPVVPINVQVRLRVWRGTELSLYDVPEVPEVRTEPGPRDSAKLADARFAFVPEKGVAVEAKAQLVPVGEARLLITPARPLAPSTRYTLVAHGVDDRDGTRKPHDYRLQQYTTAADADHTAPSFAVRRARFGRFTQRHPFNDKGNVYGRFVEADLRDLGEDAKQLVFEVTPLGEGAPPPFWTTTSLSEDTEASTLRFGAVGWCDRVDMDFPKTGEGRFELRAVDLAGNESAPVTFTVRYDHPYVKYR